MQQLAKDMIAARTTEQLIEMFEITETEENTEELFTVRGWIMDELEARDEEAFNNWIDNGYDESPRAYFLNK